MKVEMIYLSQEDVIRCGGMSMDKAVDDLEEVFRLYDKGGLYSARQDRDEAP